MEEEKKESNWGGKRAFAGRKKKGGVGTKQVSVRIRINYLELIKDNFPILAEFVDEAIKNQLRREGLL